MLLPAGPAPHWALAGLHRPAVSHGPGVGQQRPRGLLDPGFPLCREGVPPRSKGHLTSGAKRRATRSGRPARHALVRAPAWLSEASSSAAAPCKCSSSLLVLTIAPLRQSGLGDRGLRGHLYRLGNLGVRLGRRRSFGERGDVLVGLVNCGLVGAAPSEYALVGHDPVGRARRPSARRPLRLHLPLRRHPLRLRPARRSHGWHVCGRRASTLRCEVGWPVSSSAPASSS